MDITILPPPFFLSFIQSLTCSFSLSVLHTSSYYVNSFLCLRGQSAISIKRSNLFVSVALNCLVLYLKNTIVLNLYIVLSCLIK